MSSLNAEVVVLGSGPGGYTAAFRAADLGKKVILIEKYDSIGGVCLNVGCIPSKALLHATKVMDEAEDMSNHGIVFSKPKVDLKKLVEWKQSVINRLTGGLAALAKQRNVQIVKGYGKFLSDKSIEVVEGSQKTTITFENCIIAAGSKPVKLPFVPEDPRIIDSTGALKLENFPKNMLILGGGIIGCEMAQVYSQLGAKITIVEMFGQLMPGADKDIIKPFQNRVKKKYELLLETKVVKVDAKKDGIYVTFEGKNAPEKPVKYDKVLVDVCRTTNGNLIDADKA